MCFTKILRNPLAYYKHMYNRTMLMMCPLVGQDTVSSSQGCYDETCGKFDYNLEILINQPLHVESIDSVQFIQQHRSYSTHAVTVILGTMSAYVPMMTKLQSAQAWVRLVGNQQLTQC